MLLSKLFFILNMFIQFFKVSLQHDHLLAQDRPRDNTNMYPPLLGCIWTGQQADAAAKNSVPVAKPTVEILFVMEIGTASFT
jgi:hypothetical protein